MCPGPDPQHLSHAAPQVPSGSFRADGRRGAVPPASEVNCCTRIHRKVRKLVTKKPAGAREGLGRAEQPNGDQPSSKM